MAFGGVLERFWRDLAPRSEEFRGAKSRQDHSKTPSNAMKTEVTLTTRKGESIL